MSDEPSDRASGRTRTAATVAIAVTTLAIAAVGFLEVRASSRSTTAAQSSQANSVLTMSDLLESQENAKVNYEYFLRAEQQREQAGNAFQQAIFSSAGNKALLALVQQRFEELAAKTQSLTPYTTNSRDGPGNDPAFPRHAFARATAGALRYQALEDAANARESAWESRAAKYTAILTLLAVALYLFGLALAMPRRVFSVFGAVGAVLLVAGLVWTGLVTASPPPSIPASAAQDYADGEIALETSTIGQDAAGFQASIDDFTRAIDAWPGFARAYLGRANATLSTAPQVQASLIPVDALERVVSDLEHASALGLGSGLVLEQLSGSNFSLALHDQPGLYRKAASEAREAIAILPNDPVARYTLAISLLGAGDATGAEAAYRDAIQHTLFLDASANKPRNSPQLEEGWVSGALSDLEALRAAKPDLGASIDRMKEFVVGSIGAGRVFGPAGSASFTGVQAGVTPSAVVWATSGSTGYDPSHDVLSAQWYLKVGSSSWIGIPEISGPVDPSVEPTVPQYSSRNLTSSSLPPRCLAAGDYRVELYVGSHLAGSAETSVQNPSTEHAFIDRALNLEVCHPDAWTSSKHDLPGFRRGLVAPAGSEGVYLIRYDLSLLPASLRKHTTAQITDSLLISTVNTSAALFPAKPTSYSVAQHQASLDLADSTQRSFLYKGGLVYGQCSLNPQENVAYVTLVFGPQASFDQQTGDLYPVITSLAEYRTGG